MENKIGKYEADGRRIYPDVDIYGNPFNKPATTIGIDDKTFVVVPNRFVDFRLIDELKKPRRSVATKDE